METEHLPIRDYWGSGYEPGEPYEFLARFGDRSPLQRRYRCFRGWCGGAAVPTSERDTHNDYHNRKERPKERLTDHPAEAVDWALG